MLTTKKAFTLIELLIVIAIVAILSTIGIQSFSNSQKRGRDSVRLSDLNQYRVAIENYASVNNGMYPTSNGLASVMASNNLNQYFASGLTPSEQTDRRYNYYGTDGTKYVLWVCGESQRTTTGVEAAYEVCSNGKVGFTNIGCTNNILANDTCDVD